MAEKLEFKVSSGLKDIIGKDLITDDYVAVFELVKNSYDAKASKVIITFDQNSIFIADNGKGMSKEDIQEKWLFVAYSAKKDGTEDKINEKGQAYRNKINQKKYYAGAKGIGRFSSDRLGKKLLLTTKCKDSKYCETIDVDWRKFEKDQKEDFINIQVEYQQKPFDNNFPSRSKNGTVLEINSLNSFWDREKIQGLKYSLEKLINPFSGIDNFSIEIICKRELENDKGEELERKRVNGLIKNTILDVLKLKTTKIEVAINNTEIITEIVDRGEKIYKIREKNIQYLLLEDVRISMYYLNRKAKYNFTALMGIEPVNYGSIFLFKNGFRVYPFGNKGDDSWGLDYRAQQRRSSRLSTRDLFGKVEIITDNSDEFKEASSRDGGLVSTIGSKQLLKVFDKVFIYLERYVSGVLWGRDFIKEKYFDNDEIALENREHLLSNDRENDDVSFIKENIGSKIDYVQIIKGLTKDKNIQIEYYNKELLDIVSSRLEEIKPKFIKDLQTIAEKTNDKELKNKVADAEQEISRLNIEKDKIERELEKEKGKRLKAEKVAKDAKIAQEAAEKYAREKEQEKQNAELEKDQAKTELKQKTKQNLFLQSVQTLDGDRILNYHHDIGVQAEIIKRRITLITKEINNGNIDEDDLRKTIEVITIANNKILAITHFATKANFNSSAENINADIIAYIEQYIESVRGFFDNIKIHFSNNADVELKKKFKPIEICVMLDNLFNNSIKARARNFYVDIKKSKQDVEILFSDDGNGVEKQIKNANDIFEKGYTTTNGSGLGLYHVAMIVKNDLKGTIEVSNNPQKKFEIKVVLKNGPDI
jgi:signal transduction histidine kinase